MAIGDGMRTRGLARRAMVAAVTGVVTLVAAVAPANPWRKEPTPPGGEYRPPPTQKDIVAVISGYLPAIKACYERALVGDKTLADGSVVLKLTIGVSGRVKELQVEGPPQFRQLEPCLREVVARWVFPQASGQYGTQFPLVFRAGQDHGGADRSVRQMCSVTISSVPWSELWIDGKDTGERTPVVDYKLPCGKHKLRFRRPALLIDHRELITVRPGQTFNMSYKLSAD